MSALNNVGKHPFYIEICHKLIYYYILALWTWVDFNLIKSSFANICIN